MFRRHITDKLLIYKERYKAIALVGPRQSGKTTLAKSVFPKHKYLSLEDPDLRIRALEDPKQFLISIDSDCILDEVQNVPELLSYLQGILDDAEDTRQFILTGSNSFKLNEKISQSLAGRIKILNILPLLYWEIPQDLQRSSLDEVLRFGSYPRIYKENLDPFEWCSDYYNTYVQKDLRSLVNITDLTQFDRFIRVCAGRASQLTQFSSIASEVGISQPTANKWSSVLETSFIIFRLQPHFKNFNKRIIKSPKIYFYDTGLLCYLLRIQSQEQLSTHPLRGAIFENWIISELQKSFLSTGIESPLYFWRDQHGHEIDLVIDTPPILHPIEIKSGITFQPEWTKNLDWLNKLQNHNKSTIFYGGTDNFTFKDSAIVSWKDMEKYAPFT